MTVDEIIQNALKEDIGDGDHTTLATIPVKLKGKARLLIKENGILAGLNVAEKVFNMVDPELSLKFHMKDGDIVKEKDIAFEVEGSSRSILMAERVVLNFLQRLSGIATATRAVVDQLAGLKTQVLDTRKTTPNLRELEKYAVTVGGGVNHRSGLYDMILIKDNHVDYMGSPSIAIRAVQSYLKKNKLSLKIEVEVRNFSELIDVTNYGGVDRIMLDNFSVQDTRDAVQIIHGEFQTEASGGINLGNARKYAEAGVDFISVGFLTHNVRSLDMSLKAVRPLHVIRL
jgi:nicotinate-nucleotide pyrophosphorylase (carboxylating)